MLKRPRQQLTLRKINVQHVSKKVRDRYLKDLLIFPINDHFRVTSKKIVNDCFICTLEYLQILDPALAHLIRTLMGTEGLSYEKMLTILEYKLSSQYRSIHSVDVHFDKNFDLFEQLQPSEAMIVMLYNKTGNLHHITIFAKDNLGRACIVDPQIETICVADQCSDYLDHFRNDVLMTFIGKPIT